MKKDLQTSNSEQNNMLTFGGHLEVLRRMFIRILLVIAVFATVIFSFKWCLHLLISIMLVKFFGCLPVKDTVALFYFIPAKKVNSTTKLPVSIIYDEFISNRNIDFFKFLKQFICFQKKKVLEK